MELVQRVQCLYCMRRLTVASAHEAENMLASASVGRIARAHSRESGLLGSRLRRRQHGQKESAIRATLVVVDVVHNLSYSSFAFAPFPTEMQARAELDENGSFGVRALAGVLNPIWRALDVGDEEGGGLVSFLVAPRRYVGTAGTPSLRL